MSSLTEKAPDLIARAQKRTKFVEHFKQEEAYQTCLRVLGRAPSPPPQDAVLSLSKRKYDDAVMRWKFVVYKAAEKAQGLPCKVRI